MPTLPLLPLRGFPVFPGFTVTLHVGRPASRAAVEAARAQDGRLVAVAQRDPRAAEPDEAGLYDVGVLALLRRVELRQQVWEVTVEGLERVAVRTMEAPGPDRPWWAGRVEPLPDRWEPTPEAEALVRFVLDLVEEHARRRRKGGRLDWLGEEELAYPGRLCDAVALHLLMRLEDRQQVLAEVDVTRRLQRVAELLQQELQVLELERRIQSRVRRQVERAQREYYLREQLKAIQRELGEGGGESEAEALRRRAQEKPLPEEVRQRVLREIEHLEKMPPVAAEAAVVRAYLDWLLALPWLEESEERLDLAEAERILNREHYGLVQVKERILDYLAARQLKPDLRGPILCLVGPPGVGKTSLGRSIALALGRRFVRVSLGGIRDEAEIRGHRRTYVGAMPGRILQGLRRAGVRNPVFVLDEVDKLGFDYRGDPAAALLEVLDPEQNERFSDHYIELPFDLSRVLFVCTANSIAGIPRPLLDRMEVLVLPGYTDGEKLRIARGYLLPRQLKEHGLTPQDLRVSRNALSRLVSDYTREAGVRQLERQLAALCRKAARHIASGRDGPVRVTAANLEKFLGPPRYARLQAEAGDLVGVAVALAWTEAGGETMPVEVLTLPGSGALHLTGRLGEVMRESAQAAYTYVRARAAELGIDPELPRQVDVHVHVPENAVPKEGPSAGVALAVALASALSGRPVRQDVAMTGEITLRGRILPVGGIKEKVLAAFRAGIGQVVVPAGNARDLEEVPVEVRRRLQLVLAEHVDEVLALALRPGHPAPLPVALGEAAAAAEPFR